MLCAQHTKHNITQQSRQHTTNNKERTTHDKAHNTIKNTHHHTPMKPKQIVNHLNVQRWNMYT